MELNTLLFRAPDRCYNYSTFEEEMIWVPSKSSIIPCLYLKSFQKSSMTFLYFHANAEDLGNCYEFLDIMRCVLDVNVLAPEYPGYGLYKGSPSCEQVLKDSECIYNFIFSSLNLEPKELFIIGRSIGSGPASYLAQKGAGGLILLSPYTTIRKIVKEYIGGIFQYLIKDQMKNIKYLRNVKCPTLFIHGKKDDIISSRHSFKLAKVCGGKSTVTIPENMTHNDFKYYDDIILPIDYFLKSLGIEISEKKIKELPEHFYQVPQSVIF